MPGDAQVRLRPRRRPCRSLPDHWDVIENADAQASVPPRDVAGAQLSQFVVQRDAVEPQARRQAARENAPRRCRKARPRRWRENPHGQRARRDHPARRNASQACNSGVVIVEAIPPNSDFEDGEGINTLTSAVIPAPYGGAAFHDNHVWIRAGVVGLGEDRDSHLPNRIVNVLLTMARFRLDKARIVA